MRFPLILVLIMAICGSVQAKTVLVTGSNRGIGLEFVTQYAEAGWDVIATSRTPGDDDDLQALAARKTNIVIEALDVTDNNQIDELARKYENMPIDLLVNNAGYLGESSLQTWGSMDNDLFNKIMAVNVLGPLKVTEAFTDHLAASTDKKVIVISSGSGSIGSVNRSPRVAFYSISKSAVNMAMRGAAMQLKSQGIVVGIFSPGPVDTRMLREAVSGTTANIDMKKEFDYQEFKPLTTQESVSQMVATANNLNLDQSGEFLNYDGSTIPW